MRLNAGLAVCALALGIPLAAHAGFSVKDQLDNMEIEMMIQNNRQARMLEEMQMQQGRLEEQQRHIEQQQRRMNQQLEDDRWFRR